MQLCVRSNGTSSEMTGGSYKKSKSAVQILELGGVFLVPQKDLLLVFYVDPEDFICQQHPDEFKYSFGKGWDFS